ncbi:hypothetical protein BBI17_001882 [Phytophthora kernoviae]|uniref:Uncharacterized protein n=2 Tax=Phytophthora kernoviae TaxID=325452 RepID=A0A421EYH5_9STRA|nr:hypothetical protein G195_002480 [Phytophthora kernoviae 00238/432]KAG2529832.1 hypothetical protein JM16_001795 [Phytophthora kernoviae]KAG2531187.1 hypothetical protein JM18_001782 [Phytophthora kernoviae]RLN10603.1 hypothetical protein BBI17_001882 [Phytophthora kernoviae]
MATPAMDHPVNAELVYPWVASDPSAVSIISESAMMTSPLLRLTFEEKEELYRVRPDLEIGPAPFYNEKIEELNRRNQRRIIFAMFGGVISIILLLVFFSVWEQNK